MDRLAVVAVAKELGDGLGGEFNPNGSRSGTGFQSSVPRVSF
jgi:hypothetical protein